MITLSVSNSRAPKVSGSIRPSVSYGIQANTFANPSAKEEQSKPRPKTVFVGVVESTNGVQVVARLASGEEFVVPSGAIFGTIFSSKSFLTATSRLFIDKTLQSAPHKTAHGNFDAKGGFLLSSRSFSWQT